MSSSNSRTHDEVKQALMIVKAKLDAKLKRTAPTTPLLRLIDSVHFNVIMSMILVGNSVYIAIENFARKESNYKLAVWTVMEVVFSTMFLIEFMIKLLALKCSYFYDAWNLFDFSILCLSLFGIVVEFVIASESDADVHKEARIFRLNRVFRVLRIFRTVRLFRFFNTLRAKLLHKDFSLQLAEHVRTITACRAFIIAHCKAQSQLAVYFGDKGKIRSGAEARCILESQTEVYKAIMLAVEEAVEIDDETLLGMRLLRDNVKLTGKLAEFVHAAHKAGVVNAREAETMVHPLQNHVRIFNLQMQQTIQVGKAIDADVLRKASIDMKAFAEMSTCEQSVTPDAADYVAMSEFRECPGDDAEMVAGIAARATGCFHYRRWTQRGPRCKRGCLDTCAKCGSC
jgi:hypothetical protein